jgi:F-type H+-transporting ATPase subunit delta
MSVRLLAKRYAQALFDLAVENNITENVAHDMILVKSVLDDSRVLRKVLKNPVIDAPKKIKVLDSIFGNKIQKLTHRFLQLITSKGREMYITFIAEAFDEIYKDSKNILSVKLSTAIKVDENVKKDILVKLAEVTDKTLDITEEVDETLIGGFVLNFEDYQYDDSIKKQLKRMAKVFSENLYISKI